MQYFLGADGGGTKTEFVLTDSVGTVLDHCRLQGSNPNDCGPDTTIQILQQGALQLTSGYPTDQVSFFAGIAGCGDGVCIRQIIAAMQQMGFVNCNCSGDIQNILAAGLGEQAGAVAIMGTGCVAYGVNGGISLGEKRKTYRVGGWGSLFDDGGSGWRMGRDVLAAVLSGFDGSGRECPVLTKLCEAKIGSTVPEAISGIYRENKGFIASFAPLAFEAAAQGEAVATEILQSNIRQVAKLLGVVLRQLPTQSRPVPVVVAGGLTRQWQVLQPMLTAELSLQADGIPFSLSALKVRPVWGALLTAGLDVNCKPSAFFDN